jgi:hypothetical protein
MCGAEQTKVSFSYPSFALLGDEFNVIAHMSDQMSLKLKSIKYAGQEIEAYDKSIVIRDGTLIPISVKLKPQVRNNQLALFFDDFPDREFDIQLIEPNEIVFKVQNLYEFRPFGADQKESPTLSFSMYDDFVLELDKSVSLDDSLHLEIESGDFNQKVKKVANEFIISPEIYPNELAILKLVSGDIVLAAQGVSLHYNHLPRFEIENVQNIIDTNFNIATPNNAFNAIHMKVRVNVEKNVHKASGSDLKSFQVSTDSRHIEVNGKKRFENPEDLIVKLGFRHGSLTDSDINDLSQRKHYEFSVDVIINANKELPFKPIKRFKFAFSVIDALEISSFAVIDFGTTNSCMVNEEGKLVPADKSENEHKTRIDFLEFGNSLSEHRCEFAQIDDISGPTIAINFKSLLMRDPRQRRIYKDSFDNYKSLTPLQLTELYLRHATDTLVNFKNKRAKEIVATFPAMLNRSTRQLYFDLFDKLGYELDVESSITEPEAIAFYYLNNNDVIRQKAKKKGELLIAVFDCGGGTTDYAIVKYKLKDSEPNINVMASWGTDKFSGIYLSYVIAKCSESYLMALPQRFEDVFLYDKEESKNFSERYSYFENIKIQLSDALNKENMSRVSCREIFTNHNLDMDSPYMDVFFGRQSEDNPDIRSISSQLMQIREVLYDMLIEDQIDTPDVDFIILAGNSCKLPLFKIIAEEEYGKDRVIFDFENIKTAVARGAYIYKSRADDTFFEGLKRSQLTFYSYRNLGEKKTIFMRWLDMGKENIFRMKYSSRRGRSVNVFQMDIDENEKPAFFIKPPDVLPEGKIYLEMKYFDFKIEHRWLVERADSEEIISDWEEVFNHE